MAGLHGTAGSDYFGQISANAQTSFKSPFDLGITLKKGYCCSGLVQMANGVNLAPFPCYAENHCGPTVECSFLYFQLDEVGDNIKVSLLICSIMREDGDKWQWKLP